MTTNESYEGIRLAMEKQLDPARYLHSLGVAYTAEALAMRWGEELGRAYLAGLLHDCAKYLRREERLPLCEAWGIDVSETERKNTSLLHSKLGARLARDRYGVTDEEILSAIRFHTTGRPEMTLLEKIVFAADYVEPNRDRAPELPRLRKLVFTDLDRAVCEIAEATLRYVNETAGEGIDPMTLRTRDYYRSLLKERGEISDEFD